MMELKCAFILISVSLVLATPHGYGGYGVKGGASARAESSASAGAFGGIPVAVPLGAGYSGGFSKSSSSSSASSSASSSSSSSAFSYSGSGAGGFGLNGGAPGYGGCSSGNCQTAGDNGIPAHHGSSGSGSSGYNSANAAAAAGTEAISGLGCQGLSCASNSEKCTSGQCKPNLQTGTPSIDFNPNKCTSGQCGSALGSGASATDNESNDIRAVTASSDSVHNSDCSHGKCGLSGSSELNNYGNSNQGTSNSNNQQGSGSSAGITSHYQKPSPHLESPKFDSKCNSGNCKTGSHEPGHETSPSSYNVPIHGTYDKGEPKPSCDGVKCEKHPKEPYSPTDNSITKGSSPFDYSTSTNCAGSSCFGKPGNQVTGGSSFTARPPFAGGLNLAPGHIGHNGKPSDENKKLPNDKLPPYTGGFGGPAGILKPNEYDVRAPPANPSYISSEKLPPYEGGFGGPSGTLKPNQFDIHASVTNKPTYALPGSPSYNVQSPVGNIGTPACQAGGNCGGYSPTAGATSGASAPSGSYGTTKPNNGIHSSNDKQPTYTGGFGGPGGFLNPNKQPGYTPSGTYNSPAPIGQVPEGCKTPNCSPALSSADAAKAQSQSFGVTKPSSGPHLSSVTLPVNPTGPSGVYRPDEISSPASIPSFAHTQSPSSAGYSPSCKTGNCANYPSSSPSAGANAQAGSYGVTKPNTGVNPATPTLPQYTGGFGGPSGTINPNEHNSPGCKTGNCAHYPSSSPSAGANAQAGSYGITKPNTGVNPAAPALPQYTGGFGGPSGTISPTEHNSPGCKTGNCANYPSSSPSAGANAQAGSYGGIKPNAGVKPAAPTLPQYTSGFGGPSGTISPTEHNSPGCKTGNCANYPPSSPSAGANAQAGSYGVTQPNTGVNLAAPSHPQYTGGFGGPSGTINPNEHNSPGCKTGNCANYPSSSPSAGANAQAGSYGGIKPNTGVNPAAPALPQYTGGFGGPSGTISPTEHNSPGCKTGNCANYPLSSPSAGANAQAGSYGGIKPNAGVNPTAPTLPQYTSGFGGPSGTISPTEHNSPGCKTGNCANYPSSSPSAGANAQAASYGVTKPNTGVNPATPTLPQYTGGFGGPSGTISPTEHNSPGCKTGNCANYPSSSPSAGANAQAGSYGGIKPNAGVNPAAPTLPQYTSGFGGPSGSISPTENNSPGCKTGNCANYPPSSPSAGANAQAGSYGGIKPNAGVNPAAPTLPQYTGGFGGPSGTISPTEHNSPGCKTGNCANYPSSSPSTGAIAQVGSYGGIKPNAGVNPAAPALPQYTGGFGGPSGTVNPNEHNSPGCKTGNCANYPTSGASAGASAQPGSFGVTKPNIVVNPVTSTQPQYTGGFGGPSGALKPNEHTYVTPSTGSAPTNCKTPNCVSSPTVSADATSNANSQSGSYGITKPSAGNNPSNEKPTYSGGFGGAAGLLKPNEYTVPAVSTSPNNKPTGTSTPAVCTSGSCNLQTPHGSAPHSQNAVSSGTHATATATAEAVAYTGGFGGPPGVLAPFDDGKIGALPSNGGQAHGSQIGGAHVSQNANIHSQHGKIPSANGGPTGLAGAHGITGAQAGSNAGAAAYAGASAGASAGTHGLNNNHAENVKGGSPCSGGCGGSGSGAYNGGSTYDFSGGHGFPKLVLSGGLNGAGSISGATAKSLSGANAFGLGGSFASSSASAHASAGAYTKGGYGKR